MIFDSHIHTEVSVDSQMQATDALQRAQALGLGLVFTEHEDIDLPSDEDSTFDPKAYFEKYHALRNENLRLGVELGMIRGLGERNRAFIESAPFDQVTGSIHALAGFEICYPPFYEGREKAEAYALYLQEMEACIREHPFIDCLAHIDYIARYAPYPEPNLTYQTFADGIDKVLRALLETGTILEINTRRFNNRLAAKELLPLLARYRDLGGRYVVLGSDAHRVEAIGHAFPFAQDMAEAIGLIIVTFCQRRLEICRR